MSVTFHVPMALRAFTDGHEQIEIAGSPQTVGDALEELWAVCPGLRDRIATEQGQIREHVNVFVGPENIRYTGGIATPISAGAEILIFHAVSGGSSLS